MLNKYFKTQSSKNLRQETVDLGNKKIAVPVFDKMGVKGSGRALLVTAGMDGDEYAGMEAAYSLICEFEKGKFSGRLIIIPILNIPGFLNEMSKNPLDGKFPKHIYPGNKNGSATDRLIYWLREKYITKSDVWLDLHGASLTEALTPFILTQEPENANLKKQLLDLLKATGSETVIYEKPSKHSREWKIMQDKVCYILTESGESLERSQRAVNRHIRWVKQVMEALRMIGYNGTKRTVQKFSTRVKEYLSPFDGLWYPATFEGIINKGQLLGSIYTMDGKNKREIFAENNCFFLWGKKSLAAKKGDTLVGTACDERDVFI